MYERGLHKTRIAVHARWFTAYSLLMPRFCIVGHSNQGILQALTSIFVPRAHDPSGRWQLM